MYKVYDDYKIKSLLTLLSVVLLLDIWKHDLNIFFSLNNGKIILKDFIENQE